MLSEVANALGSSGSESNDTDLSASLASAVWTVDWMLYAMSIVRIPHIAVRGQS